MHRVFQSFIDGLRHATRTVCGLSRSRRLPTARCSTPQNASLHCLASRYVETSSLSALAELSSARHASVTDAAARSPSGRAAESSPMVKSFPRTGTSRRHSTAATSVRFRHPHSSVVPNRSGHSGRIRHVVVVQGACNSPVRSGVARSRSKCRLRCTRRQPDSSWPECSSRLLLAEPTQWTVHSKLCQRTLGLQRNRTQCSIDSICW